MLQAAKVLVELAGVPKVGRSGVTDDPQGARFAVLAPE